METWRIINIQRWIREAKSMLRRQNRANIAPQQQKKFAGLSSSSKTKKYNKRIHHIHHLPSSQIIKQRFRTTMHSFYKTKQCNTNTSPKTQINETQNDHQTISENTYIGLNSTNSPSLYPKLPLSQRRTQIIVLPIRNPITPTNNLANVTQTNPLSPSRSDRMELDIHPVRGGSTQSSPTIHN